MMAIEEATSLLAGAILFTVTAFFAWLFTAEERSRRAGLLADREDLPPEEVCGPLAADLGLPVERVVEALTFVARRLGVQPGQLRLDDRLADLAGYESWVVRWDSVKPVSTDPGLLMAAVKRCAARSRGSAEPAAGPPPETIRDVLAVLAASGDDPARWYADAAMRA